MCIKPIKQEADEDSDSEGAAGSTLDSTYECISTLGSSAAVSKEGMNDTKVLVARLDSAGLNIPAHAQISYSPTKSRFAFATDMLLNCVGVVKISPYYLCSGHC